MGSKVQVSAKKANVLVPLWGNVINLSEICYDYGSFKVHRFEGSKVLLFITCDASFYLHIRRTSEPLEPSEPFPTCPCRLARIRPIPRRRYARRPLPVEGAFLQREMDNVKISNSLLARTFEPMNLRTFLPRRVGG